MAEIATRRRTGGIGARIERLQRRLCDRMFAAGDAFAYEHRWTIATAPGRFGFGVRIYRDPRFDQRKARDRLRSRGWAELPLPARAAPARLTLPEEADPS
jgi:hypothetical protein